MMAGRSAVALRTAFALTVAAQQLLIGVSANMYTLAIKGYDSEDCSGDPLVTLDYPDGSDATICRSLTLPADGSTVYGQAYCDETGHPQFLYCGGDPTCDFTNCIDEGILGSGECGHGFGVTTSAMATCTADTSASGTETTTTPADDSATVAPASAYSFTAMGYDSEDCLGDPVITLDYPDGSDSTACRSLTLADGSTVYGQAYCDETGHPQFWYCGSDPTCDFANCIDEAILGSGECGHGFGLVTSALATCTAMNEGFASNDGLFMMNDGMANDASLGDSFSSDGFGDDGTPSDLGSSISSDIITDGTEFGPCFPFDCGENGVCNAETTTCTCNEGYLSDFASSSCEAVPESAQLYPICAGDDPICIGGSTTITLQLNGASYCCPGGSLGFKDNDGNYVCTAACSGVRRDTQITPPGRRPLGQP